MRPIVALLAPILPLAALVSSPALAHEFWIAPEAYQVAPGEAIAAATRNGERFSGRSIPYLPERTERFEIVLGDETAPALGRVGDRPALSQPAPGEGLAVIVHETGDYPLTYDDLAAFERFAAHKGFPEAVEAQRGRPSPVRERFRRYAKSLVAVGDGEGADRPMGLRAEIVALANPYTDDLSAMPVEVLYEGRPAPGQQVEVFARDAEGAVTVTTQRTDADGRATVPVEPHTEVMLDAVFIEPDDEADWATHWANLTFAVP